MSSPRKKTQTKKTAPAVESLAAPDVPTFYANRVALQVSTWDFRFSFEEIVEATQEKHVSKVLTRVYLSPSHMKAVLGLIDRQIKIYEKTHGKILDIESKVEIA